MSCDNYQVVKINPSNLVIERGFNPREAIIGDLCYELEPVKSTITSIKQAYKDGRRVDLIKVVERDGKYIVRQGHCRTYSLRLAITEGANISLISVILLTYQNEIEEYLENLDGNRSNGLNPVGQAHALAQAIQMGFTVDGLAQRYQRSTTAIRNMLKILDMPTELQRLISLGHIKKTLAIEIMLRYGNDHSKVLEHLSDSMPISKDKSVIEKFDKVLPIEHAEKNDIKNSEPTQHVKENKPITRSTLGIKRLSQKRTERLKSGFISLTENLDNNNDLNKTLTELSLDKKHSNLFNSFNSKQVKVDETGVKLILDSAKLEKLLSFLDDDNVAIIVPKSQINDLSEIRAMLVSDE